MQKHFYSLLVYDVNIYLFISNYGVSSTSLIMYTLRPIIKLICSFNYANAHLRCEKVTVKKISHCPPVAPRGEAIASAGDSPHKYHTNCSTAPRIDCCNYSANPFASPRPRGGENALIYRPDRPAQLFDDGVKQQSNLP